MGATRSLSLLGPDRDIESIGVDEHDADLDDTSELSLGVDSVQALIQQYPEDL